MLFLSIFIFDSMVSYMNIKDIKMLSRLFFAVTIFFLLINSLIILAGRQGLATKLFSIIYALLALSIFIYLYETIKQK